MESCGDKGTKPALRTITCQQNAALTVDSELIHIGLNPGGKNNDNKVCH